MKILSNNKIGNIALIIGLALCVVLMLSSFITRVVTPPVESELDANTQPTNEVEQAIQVNVLNACGKNGLAKEVQNFLMERGYDVVSIGNYDEKLENSMIVDRLGDVSSANKVAYALGVNDSAITCSIDSAMFVRATVIVGKDYLDLKPFKF